jgi:transposase-like protein
MSQVEKRTFSGDFKRAAVRRMEAGESSAALSRELAVKRTLLYRWWVQSKGRLTEDARAHRKVPLSLPP